MAESIKDKVAIVGMGCTKFGELWSKDVSDLIADAVSEALQDAGIEIKDIDAAWLGQLHAEAPMDSGASGACLSSVLQLQYIPVTRVENACATGTECIRGAVYGLISKAYDLVLAVGVEKMKDRGIGGLAPVQAGPWHPVIGAPGAAVSRYALAATRYFAKYGLNSDEGKRMLAKVSVKSHHNGARNPRAHLRFEITEEQVLKAPIIAWPLGLFDCCGVTDGASAAVLCRTEDARNFRDDYVTIKASAISVGPGYGKERGDLDYGSDSYLETEYAAKSAYAQAGIKNPRKELDMAELHDCFSIAEVMAIESLGFCEKGHCKEEIEAGTWTQEGELPIGLSGGLKSFGHPIGASGCREVYEIYKEIQGKAEEPSRQLRNCQLGLAHNQGGHPGTFQCGITIIGAP